MKKEIVVNNAQELIAAIIARANHQDGCTIILQGWTNQEIIGSRAGPNEKPDIISHLEILPESENLEEFLTDLIKNGTPFITQTGEEHTLCRLKWTRAK